jgi:pyroglutamyl-peptidase
LLVAIRGARVRAALSHSAGAYVCNYLYWRALEAQSAAHVPLVVFVHVPKPVEGKRRREIAQKRRLTFDDLVRAGEIILATAVSYARKRR